MGAMMSDRAATQREWIGLAVLALPCMLYSMDLTVLHLAVPALSQQLRPSATELLWIIDVYGFLVAGSLITMGTLGDRIGRRKLLLVGSAIFGAASILAAFSTSAPMLIATRALLGIAGATIAPSTLSLVRNMFQQPKQFGAAIGVVISAYSVGAAVGPLVGGLMLQFFWWGSVFLVSVPVMVLIMVVGPRLLPEYKAENAGLPDVLSAALSMVTVLGVIFGLKEIAAHGPSAHAVTAIVVGAAAGLAFARRQQTLAEPFIDLSLFRVPAFASVLATYTLSILAAFGAFLFIPQYLQLVRHQTALEAGLWTLGWPLAFVVGSIVVPIIARRIRPGAIMASGLALAALGNVILSNLDAHTPLIVLVLGTTITGLGLSPIFTLATELIIGSAPPERAGAASAIAETGSELAVALGIAILGSLGTAVYRAQLAVSLPTGLAAEAAHTASETLGGAIGVASLLPDELGLALLDAAGSAFVHGLQLSALASAIVALALAAIAAVVLRDMRSGAGADHDTLETETIEQPAEACGAIA
jgi:MFS transporter, DHA2 family, multidrug resistance protein